jgi:hypothetical protein
MGFARDAQQAAPEGRGLPQGGQPQDCSSRDDPRVPRPPAGGRHPHTRSTRRRWSASSRAKNALVKQYKKQSTWTA